MVSGTLTCSKANDGQVPSHGDSRYITCVPVLVLLTNLLPTAIRAVLSSPESSASTLPRKRSKDHAGAAPQDGVHGASSIEGDLKYLRRKIIGSSQLEAHATEKHGHAPKVTLHLHCSVVLGIE
jgi:hypothetical protein